MGYSSSHFEDVVSHEGEDMATRAALAAGRTVKQLFRGHKQEQRDTIFYFLFRLGP